MKNKNINKTIVSKKVSFFIGYKDAKIRPLWILLPKMIAMIAYRREFDETKYMLFLIKDELLEKSNEICEKVSKSIKKELDSKSLYDKKYLKAKINSYNEKSNTNKVQQ